MEGDNNTSAPAGHKLKFACMDIAPNTISIEPISMNQIIDEPISMNRIFDEPILMRSRTRNRTPMAKVREAKRSRIGEVQ